MPTNAYDPFDPDFLDEPWSAYARLRDHDPVHHHPATRHAPSFWALSRFEDIWEAVRRPELFSSAQGLTFHPDEIGQLGLAPTIVMLDPPRHTQLRALIGRGFTPKRIALMESHVREFARGLLAEMRERHLAGEAIDLHRDYATQVPTYTLASLLGVPAEDRHRFDPWVSALTELQVGGFDPGALTAPDAVAEMFGYFSEVIASRRTDPHDDLIGALVAAEIDGERLTDWDILGFCFVMVAGGNDTTGALVSHAIGLLDRFPEQRELLLADPALIGPAVPEFLRLESSVQGLARTTTEDVTLHGVTIPAGEKVMMLYAAANRDPREFGDTAAELDVRRQPPRHLAFSSGPHFCIGSHLAKLQATIALEELLDAFPQITVDEAAGERHRSAFTRGWRSLPADPGVTSRG